MDAGTFRALEPRRHVPLPGLSRRTDLDGGPGLCAGPFPRAPVAACEEAKTGTNGDGFGLGWYGERPEPGLFRDIRPAWSDENLKSLSVQVRSPLFFAHVWA